MVSHGSGYTPRCGERADGLRGQGSLHVAEWRDGAVRPADGLPNDEVVAGEPSVGWLTTHGEIWFPTRGGVAIVDSEHLPANAVAPPIVLQRFSVDDLSEPIGADSIKIPFGHARFTMEYAGLSFTAPIGGPISFSAGWV